MKIFFHKLKQLLFGLLLFFITSTIASVIAYKFIPVYVTPLMLIRSFQQFSQGNSPKFSHTWLPLDSISPHLAQAVIASEDNRFPTHNGFDWIEIKKAVKENESRKRPRGASTISQQTAKNVFLWPASSWFRKGLETYFTFLIELTWSKERIMEVYLNSIEMGKNIYGADAVAKKHFHTTARKLSRSQCALIAATLPNPIQFNSAKPSRYMLRRQKQILHNMKNLPIFPPHKTLQK